MRETTWKFYISVEEAWEAMLAACESAKTSIDIEQYVFFDDEIGQKFIAVLIKKSRAGVKVRVLADAIGSQPLLASPVVSEMAQAGIQVLFFNVIAPWWLHNLFSWFLRDHRKILVIDGATGFTGGVGIENMMFGWRDTVVAITGPVVGEMVEAFERLWMMTLRGKRFSREKPRIPLGWDFSFVANSPSFRQRHLYRALLTAIRSAKQYIYLTSPYFIPDHRLFDALKDAHQRHVDIRIIVPENSDHPIVDLASRSYYTPALRAGANIYRFKKRVMHAKAAVIDDAWATVGSANLDNLSLLLNYEGNIVSTNPRFISDVKAHFLDDLTNCDQLVKAQWVERSFFQKFLELLTYPLHRLF